MEKLYSIGRLNTASYKAFQWDGNAENANSLMKDQSGVKVYASHKAYIMEHPEKWSQMNRERELYDRARKVEQGPIAVIYAYHSTLVELNAGCWFVFGHFADYSGSLIERWNVLGLTEMQGFVGIEKAKEILNGN